VCVCRHDGSRPAQMLEKCQAGRWFADLPRDVAAGCVSHCGLTWVNNGSRMALRIDEGQQRRWRVRR